MPIYKKSNLPMDRWMPMLLGLRLRQMEKEFPTYGQFAEATGLSRGTLYHLRTGHANPTLQTIGTLAASLGVSVWSLLGLRDDDVRRSIESFGLSYGEIAEHIKQEDRSARVIEQLLA